MRASCGDTAAPRLRALGSRDAHPRGHLRVLPAFTGSVSQSRTFLKPATPTCNPWQAPSISQDWPHHCWRGLHLDAVRNWMPVPFVKPLGVIQVPFLTRGLSLTACNGTAARLFRYTQRSLCLEKIAGKQGHCSHLASMLSCQAAPGVMQRQYIKAMATYKAEMRQLPSVKSATIF